jgi:hypothetical protein
MRYLVLGSLRVAGPDGDIRLPDRLRVILAVLTPVPATLVVSVDPRLVGNLRVASVQFNRKLYRALWRCPVLLEPGDVVDLHLRVSARTPPGSLATIKHPVVSLTGMGSGTAQRRTGQESLARLDSYRG